MDKRKRHINNRLPIKGSEVLITKLLFVICWSSCILYLIWIKLATSRQNNNDIAFQNVDPNHRPNTFPKGFKYILLWTDDHFPPFNFFGKGQAMFIRNNCSENKCYVTSDRTFFGDELAHFDAIAFNGRNMTLEDLPDKRFYHQHYIYFNMESADNCVVCNKTFDGFFNLTSTYRLDSDIPSPYIQIRDMEGEVVGPKRKMRWKKYMAGIHNKFAIRIQNKTKAAAWFVSHCHAKSGRQEFATKLNKALKRYDLALDVYGKCGTLSCPSQEKLLCNNLLKYDYFFYMSMENSLNEDYVTEKLLTALQNDVVPIVYGGADYTRFLPPGSYINSRMLKVSELAALMNRLIHFPKEYSQYFRWKHYYTYHNPDKTDNVCALCEALHDRALVQKTSIYSKFRSWWNPKYKKKCQERRRIQEQMLGNSDLMKTRS